jgi:hypothetical protein
MKKQTLAAAALTLALGPALWAADPAAPNTAPGATGAAAPTDASNIPSSMGQAQTAPDNWTSLSGTVQAVDAAAKTVEIKDAAGMVVQVPVDKQVTIQKDGKAVKLNQVKTGDSIILAKKGGASSTSGASGAGKTY